MAELEFFALLASIIGLFIWNRSESRADFRHMDSKLEIYVQTIREEIRAIQEEIKDFHGRLCAIEERKHQK